MKISVLLADDHRIVRQGVKALLERDEALEVVAEAGDGREAVAKAKAHLPRVVVMDLNMPVVNGIEATREIISENPDIRVLAFSMAAERPWIVEAIKAGVAGYLLKDCTAEDLVGAIRSVAAGGSYLCPQVAGVIMDNVKTETRGPVSRLSAREQDVLKLIAEGKNMKEIAFQFGVSTKTVEVQRTSISKKLNLHSIAELTKYAIREGITSV